MELLFRLQISKFINFNFQRILKEFCKALPGFFVSSFLDNGLRQKR